MWHAVGAFKTVGFSRTGKKGGPFIDSLNHRSYTKAYVSSETDIPFYAEAFGIREENVVPTGVPRTDVLFDEAYATQIKQEMEDELPIIKGKKVLCSHRLLEVMVTVRHIIHFLKLILNV